MEMKRKIMDEAPVSITEIPEFSEPQSTRFITQTVRDPNTGRLCYSVSEFVDPETLKKLKDLHDETN